MARRMTILIGLVFAISLHAAMFVPLARAMLTGDAPEDLKEKRTLAARPALEWNIASIEAFPDAFEQYYDDHFGYRDVLVKYLAYFRLNFLGVSPKPKRVTLGKEGWLFFTQTLKESMPEGCPFGESHLENLRMLFEEWHDRLAKQGIPYILVVAPDKKDVYGEYLPRMYAKKAESGWQVDHFIAHMKQHSKVPLLDLAPVLRAQKGKGPLYFKTDTHWNSLGAFLAAQAIAAAIRDQVPSIGRPVDIRECTVSFRGAKGRDLASMLGLGDWILDRNLVSVTPPGGFQAKRAAADTAVPPQRRPGQAPHKPIVMETPNEALPRAVIFRDSFSNALFPYLSEHFSRSVYYWQRHGQQDILGQEKPDIVIHEIVAREIRRFCCFPDAAW